MTKTDNEEWRARYGPWALVAGASVGLGAAFAVGLARRGLNLVLVARRGEVLEPLARALRADHQVDVQVIAADLADPSLGARISALAAELEIGLLVYNAAAAKIGPFLDLSLEDQLRIIDVNCRGPVVLSHVLGGAMARRGRGGIILMTSMAASQGSPYIATYASSKAFNLVLGESLWYELAEKHVDVLACRAGATRTPNFEESAPKGNATPVMEPEAVVGEALGALGRKPSTVPGAFNRMASFFLGRVVTRRMAITTMGKTTRKMYGF